MFQKKRTDGKYTSKSQMEYDDGNIPDIDTDEWGEEEFEDEINSDFENDE